MVKIEEWEFYVYENRTPSTDNVTYYNPPNSIKFSVPGTVNGHSGVLSSITFSSEQNKMYTLSGRVKAENIFGTESPVLRFVESDINDNWLRATQITFEKGTYDWTLKSINVTTGSSTANVYITSYLQNGYGTYWLDDVNISSSTDSTCPQLQSMLTIKPTTIVSGESFTFTSMALGGEESDDGFGHEIFIGGESVYNTGLRQAITMSGIVTPSNLSPGKYNVVSKITDGCLPIHQIAYSSPVALNIDYPTCLQLSATLSIPKTTINSGDLINFTSTAIDGQPHGDGFKHEIFIDGNLVYDTGVKQARSITSSILLNLTVGNHTVISKITDGCLPNHQTASSSSITLTVTKVICLPLSASLTIKPTTIASGGSFTYTSEAIGGVPEDNGFGHEIFIDGNSVYNTGLRLAREMSGTLQISNISAGNHTVISKITDGCLPNNQTATSPAVTLTVTGITCPLSECNFTITQ